MREIPAVLADFALAMGFSAAQFVVLWYIRALFTTDRFLMFPGSPLSLLLGPAFFILIRKGRKSRNRKIGDLTLAVLLGAALVITFASIGGGAPSLFDDLQIILFAVAVPVAEAVALLAVEKAVLNRFRCG